MLVSTISVQYQYITCIHFVTFCPSIFEFHNPMFPLPKPLYTLPLPKPLHCSTQPWQWKIHHMIFSYTWHIHDISRGFPFFYHVWPLAFAVCVGFRFGDLHGEGPSPWFGHGRRRGRWRPGNSPGIRWGTGRWRPSPGVRCAGSMCKLPTIWTDEKQSKEDAKRRERLEERRVEEKESEERRCRCAKR